MDVDSFVTYEPNLLSTDQAAPSPLYATSARPTAHDQHPHEPLDVFTNQHDPLPSGCVDPDQLHGDPAASSLAVRSKSRRRRPSPYFVGDLGRQGTSPKSLVHDIATTQITTAHAYSDLHQPRPHPPSPIAVGPHVQHPPSQQALPVQSVAPADLQVQRQYRPASPQVRAFTRSPQEGHDAFKSPGVTASGDDPASVLAHAFSSPPISPLGPTFVDPTSRLPSKANGPTPSQSLRRQVHQRHHPKSASTNTLPTLSPNSTYDLSPVSSNSTDPTAPLSPVTGAVQSPLTSSRLLVADLSLTSPSLVHGSPLGTHQTMAPYGLSGLGITVDEVPHHQQRRPSVGGTEKLAGGMTAPAGLSSQRSSASSHETVRVPPTSTSASDARGSEEDQHEEEERAKQQRWYESKDRGRHRGQGQDQRVADPPSEQTRPDPRQVNQRQPMPPSYSGPSPLELSPRQTVSDYSATEPDHRHPHPHYSPSHAAAPPDVWPAPSQAQPAAPSYMRIRVDPETGQQLYYPLSYDHPTEFQPQPQLTAPGHAHAYGPPPPPPPGPPGAGASHVGIVGSPTISSGLSHAFASPSMSTEQLEAAAAAAEATSRAAAARRGCQRLASDPVHRAELFRLGQPSFSMRVPLMDDPNEEEDHLEGTGGQHAGGNPNDAKNAMWARLPIGERPELASLKDGPEGPNSRVGWQSGA